MICNSEFRILIRTSEFWSLLVTILVIQTLKPVFSDNLEGFDKKQSLHVFQLVMQISLLFLTPLQRSLISDVSDLQKSDF